MTAIVHTKSTEYAVSANVHYVTLKKNLHYGVKECKSVEVFLELVAELKSLRTKMKRTIIFCQTIRDCTTISYFFKDHLRNEAMEPQNAPDLSQFRLVNMFHRFTEESVKSNITSSFTKESILRLICTTAFGLGINCVDVRRVFHYGPPDSMESYIQETGRCGRDGRTPCHCILYLKKPLRRSIQSNMRTYLTSTTCRRNSLFHNRVSYTTESDSELCCDICDIRCKVHL